MDFTTINLIAYARHYQGMLDETPANREAKSVLRPLLRQSGRLFVTIGQRMVEAGSQTTERYPSLEHEAC